MALKILNDIIFALMNDTNNSNFDRINVFLRDALICEYEDLLVAADPIPSLALKMASNILVFNSKL